jgi:type IV pilus assembly protein PilX
MARNITPIRRQRGAALVVGLLLLLILTLLAISSMNSASVEFIMAGNEQYHQNAFQAAETGIAQTLATVDFNTATVAPPPITGMLSTIDSYSATYAAPLGNKELSAVIWTGMTIADMASYHFEIQSTGTSARNSQTTNVQGVVKIARSSAIKTADPNLPDKQLE